MENNFDIKKYLVENKMTRNSRLLNESFESEIAENDIELDEQESSLEDELMAQLDEKVGPWSLKKRDQHPENFEPSYDDEDYEEYEGSETPEPDSEEELDELNFNLKDDPNAEKGRPYIPKKFTLGDRQIEFLKKHGAKENKGTLYIPTELSGDLANRSSKIKRDFGFTFGSDAQAQQKSSGFLSALKNYFTKANSATIGAARYFMIPSEDGVYEFPNPYFMKENEEELEENWDDLDEEINAILEMDEISSKSKIAKFNDADSYHKASYWGNEEGADITNVDNQEKTITFTGDESFFKELGATISYSDSLSEEDALYTMDEFDESLDEIESDNYICWDAGGGIYDITKYDPNISWHDDSDVFHGTYAECVEYKKEAEYDKYRFDNYLPHKSNM